MTMLSNIDAAKINLYARKGDTIDMLFYVSYELLSTGKKYYISLNSAPSQGSALALGSLRIYVRRKDRLLLKEWISGVSPSDIVISGSTFHLYDISGFLESGVFDFYIEEYGTEIFTIATGEFYVSK